MSLAEALERAAGELPEDADEIRPANGDAFGLLDALDQDAALRVLRWMLSFEPAATEELAASWVEDERGVAMLAGLPEEGLPKAGRKVLRRVHHRLRSAGVEVGGGPTVPVVARLAGVDETFEGGFLSLPDSQGMQLVFLVASAPQRGARIFEALLDVGLGVIKLSTYETGRSDARQFLRTATQKRRGSLVPAPAEAVKALLLRAAAAQGAERPLVRNFIQWKRCFEVPEGTPTPGESALAELGAVESEEALEDAARLLADRLGPWPPAEDAAKLAVEEALQLTQAGGDGAREEALARGAESLLTEEARAALAARFTEAAYALWKLGDEKDARACAVAVTSLARGRGAAAPVERAFVEGVLKPALQSQAGLDGDGDEHQNTDAAPISDSSAEEMS